MIDSHCHLHHIDLPQQTDPIDYCIQQAVESGIKKLLCVSITLDEHSTLCDIADKYPSVHISTGQHPNNTQTWSPSLKQTLLEQAAHPKVIAIGETGLDYFRTTSTKQQKLAFRDHIECAITNQKPLIIHTRDAFDDTVAILKDMNAEKVGGIFHCFTGSPKQAEQALELGFYISFSGIITFKNAHEIRESAKIVPLDKLLIETDSPYLAPVPYRGKVNQPAWVTHVCDKLAEIHTISSKEMSSITDQNFEQLFYSRSV